MAERGRQLLIGAAAIVVIGGVIGWRSLRGTPRAKPPGPAASVPASVPAPDLAPLMPYAAPLPDSAVGVGARTESVVVRRDPFRDAPAAATVAARPGGRRRAGRAGADEWNVSATLIGGARRAAVINDALVYEGDPIPGGGKLTSVERDRVVVTDPHGSTHTVAVKEGDE